MMTARAGASSGPAARTTPGAAPWVAAGHRIGVGFWRDLGLWSLAELVVLGLHGGALTLYIRDRRIPIADGGPPPATLLDLAPLP